MLKQLTRYILNLLMDFEWLVQRKKIVKQQYLLHMSLIVDVCLSSEDIV